MDLLSSNRESMRALADFLKTKEPPPDHFMSLPDSDTMSHHSMKKSAFWLLGRSKSKKSKGSKKLLQLPDSAVSAKTLGGARHIAISIPLEYDYQDNIPSTQIRPHSQPNMLPSDRMSHITVLKPVREVRESVSSHNPSNIDLGKRDSRLSARSTQAAAELLGPETTRTLENYYTQLSHQQKKEKDTEGSSKGMIVSEPLQTPKTYVAVSPIYRRDSERSVDPRHSGGTAYSTISIATNRGHSRGKSSVSTAPSINPLGSHPVKLQPDLPPRTSSIPKVPRSLQTELAQIFAVVNKPARENNLNSPFRSDQLESLASPQSCPTDLGIAEAAQAYSSMGIENIRGHTPKLPTPAPTCRLPDVPESPLVPSFMPQPSPPLNEGKITTPVITQTPRSLHKASKSSSEDPILVALQSRQERVKARKARDMAALRQKGTNLQPLSDISREHSLSVRPSTAPGHVKRRSLSRERLYRCKQNTLSAIMLVADLAPIIGVDYLSSFVVTSLVDNNLVANGIGSPISQPNHSVNGTHTPPRSFISSEFSGSETIPKEESRGRGRDALSPRSVRSRLDSRRQDRRYKRNMSLKEKELDARLQKIENDNIMLTNALSGIAKSFSELNRILPGSRPTRDGGLLLGYDMDRIEIPTLSTPYR